MTEREAFFLSMSVLSFVRALTLACNRDLDFCSFVFPVFEKMSREVGRIWKELEEGKEYDQKIVGSTFFGKEKL